jgi:hypothetical protein
LWSTLQSVVGGNTSKPITAATTYTLKCVDLTGAQNQSHHRANPPHSAN